MMSRTRTAAVALAAACTLLGGGCGTQGGSGGRGDMPGPVSATHPAGEDGAGDDGAGDDAAVGQVVYFTADPHGPLDGHQVLDDQTAAEHYAAAFAERDRPARDRIVAAARATDFTRQVLLGWTATTGCSAATAAALHVSGNRLELRVSQPEPPQECVRAFQVSVVVKVPRERMPAHPEFG